MPYVALSMAASTASQSMPSFTACFAAVRKASSSSSVVATSRPPKGFISMSTFLSLRNAWIVAVASCITFIIDL